MATPILLELLDAGDAELAQAAALALGWSRDPAALSPLLGRALLPKRFALADAAAPVAALVAWSSGARPPDEARLMAGTRPDVDAVIALASTAGPAAFDLVPLWREHTRELAGLLGDALTRPTEERREALGVIDGTGDALAIGALASDAAGGPETAVAIREVLQPLADRLAALLEDGDDEVQAGALRVLVKLGDERATPARIAAAASDGSPVLASAAIFASARVARERPGAAAAVALLVGPQLGDERWERRLAAVEVLGALGPTGLSLLERTRTDRHPVVRAALSSKLRPAARLDLPAAPSTMP
jgi:HEAT repeat protein